MSLATLHQVGSNRLNDVQVQVRVAGTWYDGWLDPDYWRQVDGRWRGFVRWSSAPAEQRLDHFDQDDIRRVTDPPS